MPAPDAHAGAEADADGSADADTDRLAQEIDDAHLAGRLLDARQAPELGLIAAYRTHRALTRRRLARGARRIGWKLGYTSAAMRAQIGIDQPNIGPLLDGMLVTTAGRLASGQRTIQPRVEPEIAIVIGADGRAGEVRAALEIVDSVWRDHRFTLELNTADGSSAAGVLLGPTLPVSGLTDLPVRMSHNGVGVAEATPDAAMSHPFAALDWLARTLADHGERLHPGDVVLTGGLTSAVALGVDDTVSAVFDVDVVLSVTGRPLR